MSTHGRIGALGHGVAPLVQDLVEDLQPLVGQPDLIGVGVDEQPGQRPGPVVEILGPFGAELTADVAGRLFDLVEEGLDLRPEGLHVPRDPTAPPAASGANPGQRA